MSNIVDNFAEGIDKIKCKDCDCLLEYESFNGQLIKIDYKCLSCHKNYSDKVDKKCKKWFKNTFKFSNNDINEFILLLRKVVYSYEIMDEWENLDKTSLPEKK